MDSARLFMVVAVLLKLWLTANIYPEGAVELLVVRRKDDGKICITAAQVVKVIDKLSG